MLAPFECLCGNFILPEPASYVFFYAVSNLRNLLYIIKSMPIILDHQLREPITFHTATFPITYFCDELASLPNWTGPLHWHPDFEIVTAVSGVLDFQVGQQHIILEAGDSIFVNGSVLHGIRQLSGDIPDPMPNVVFSGAVVAPETCRIYGKYIQPVASCDTLPFILFDKKEIGIMR